MLRPESTENKVNALCTVVEEKTKRVLELKDVAHVSQQSDVKDIVTNTGQG